MTVPMLFRATALSFLLAGLVLGEACAADARCGGAPVAMAPASTGGSASASAAHAMPRPSLEFARQAKADPRSPSGVVLAGIVLPASAGPVARQRLREAIERLDASLVTVYGANGRLDRRGRVRGQAVVEGPTGRPVWVQAALVSEGLAVVTDDAGDCADVLLGIEAAARRGAVGLFAGNGPALDAASLDRAPAALPDFVILEGMVVSVGKTDATTYLNFGEERRLDATVRVARRISAGFGTEKDLSRLAGIRVRVRGWAFHRDGLDLSLSAPGALEIIGERRFDRRGT